MIWAAYAVVFLSALLLFQCAYDLGCGMVALWLLLVLALAVAPFLPE